MCLRYDDTRQSLLENTNIWANNYDDDDADDDYDDQEEVSKTNVNFAGWCVTILVCK